MTNEQEKVRFVLQELFTKLCNCLRDDPDKEDLLNPKFHEETCAYRELVEREVEIEWTQES